jgi:hypothetical protein
MHSFAIAAQIIIACSIVLVWVIRFPNVVMEFQQYGLSDALRTWVGAAKISLATLLVAGIWYPALVPVPALLMACLMVCALFAHLKVHHAWQKYVPSALLLILSVFVAYVYRGSVNL